MKMRTARFALRLGAVVALTGLIVVVVAVEKAVAQLPPAPSDELLITAPGGAPVFGDTLIPETIGAGTQPSAIFPGALVPPGALPGLIPPGGPGLMYVILTEPVGEPADPGELPPVFYPTPDGLVRVSDLIINAVANPGGQPLVALVSDNNPDLAAYVGALPPFVVPTLLETGGLQDLSPIFGFPVFPGFGPIDIQVRSDVNIPEPSSFVLGIAALVGLGFPTLWQKFRRA